MLNDRAVRWGALGLLGMLVACGQPGVDAGRSARGKAENDKAGAEALRIPVQPARQDHDLCRELEFPAEGKLRWTTNPEEHWKPTPSERKHRRIEHVAWNGEKIALSFGPSEAIDRLMKQEALSYEAYGYHEAGQKTDLGGMFSFHVINDETIEHDDGRTFLPMRWVVFYFDFGGKLPAEGDLADGAYRCTEIDDVSQIVPGHCYWFATGDEAIEQSYCYDPEKMLEGEASFYDAVLSRLGGERGKACAGCDLTTQACVGDLRKMADEEFGLRCVDKKEVADCKVGQFQQIYGRAEDGGVDCNRFVWCTFAEKWANPSPAIDLECDTCDPGKGATGKGLKTKYGDDALTCEVVGRPPIPEDTATSDRTGVQEGNEPRTTPEETEPKKTEPRGKPILEVFIDEIETDGGTVTINGLLCNEGNADHDSKSTLELTFKPGAIEGGEIGFSGRMPATGEGRCEPWALARQGVGPGEYRVLAKIIAAGVEVLRDDEEPFTVRGDLDEGAPKWALGTLLEIKSIDVDYDSEKQRQTVEVEICSAGENEIPRDITAGIFFDDERPGCRDEPDQQWVIPDGTKTGGDCVKKTLTRSRALDPGDHLVWVMADVDCALGKAKRDQQTDKARYEVEAPEDDEETKADRDEKERVPQIYSSDNCSLSGDPAAGLGTLFVLLLLLARRWRRDPTK